MAGHQGEERRKKPRIPRRLPVRFGSDARMCGGTAVDIAEGGLRVETGESFPVNSVVLVFVQFPRHSVRLRARVAWVTGQGGGSPLMGLAFTQPEPGLARAYKEWQAEVRLAATGGDAAETAPASDGAPAPAAAAAGAPGASSVSGSAAPQNAEPRGPVRRRVETRQGNAYDVLLEKNGGWRLTIVQVPRQLGVDAPDLERGFPDYAAADRALRDFLKTH
jgi:Tfp pilus assembly protein PilZ